MNNLNKYSDFKIVNNKALHLYNRPVFVSTRKDKKYMILNDNKKFIHFGAMGYSDFTKHMDENRRRLYLARALKIKGNWKIDRFSPNNLSIHLLW